MNDMNKIKYFSTKTYGHERGLSCAFRQPGADSHCKLIHGYSLSFSFKFGCEHLDDNNWVVDFGGLKALKDWLEDNFDHKLTVDKADPNMKDFLLLEEQGLAEVRVLNGVGCEKFAELVAKYLNNVVQKETNGRVSVSKVQCWQQEDNMAEYHN